MQQDGKNVLPNHSKTEHQDLLRLIPLTLKKDKVNLLIKTIYKEKPRKANIRLGI